MADGEQGRKPTLWQNILSALAILLGAAIAVGYFLQVNLLVWLVSHAVDAIKGLFHAA